MSLHACARAHRESHPPPQIQSLHLVIIVVLQTNVPESGKYAVTALTANMQQQTQYFYEFLVDPHVTTSG